MRSLANAHNSTLWGVMWLRDPLCQPVDLWHHRCTAAAGTATWRRRRTSSPSGTTSMRRTERGAPPCTTPSLIATWRCASGAKASSCLPSASGDVPGQYLRSHSYNTGKCFAALVPQALGVAGRNWQQHAVLGRLGGPRAPPGWQSAAPGWQRAAKSHRGIKRLLQRDQPGRISLLRRAMALLDSLTGRALLLAAAPGLQSHLHATRPWNTLLKSSSCMFCTRSCCNLRGCLLQADIASFSDRRYQLADCQIGFAILPLASPRALMLQQRKLSAICRCSRDIYPMQRAACLLADSPKSRPRSPCLEGCQSIRRPASFTGKRAS